MAIKQYKRGDGQVFHADEGSASEILMRKSGEFKEVVEVDGELVDAETVGDTAQTEDAEIPKVTPGKPVNRKKK